MPYQQNQQSKPKDYWPAVSFLVVILIIAVGYFVIYPSMNALKDLNIQISAKNKEAEAMEAKINDLYALQKSFSGNQEKITKFDSALPKEDDFAKIMENVNSIAGASALSIISINQLKSTKETKYTPVEIGFEGSFASLELFLEKLEKNIRPSSPKQISISAGQNKEGEEDKKIVDGKIELEFFKVGSSSKISKSETENNNTEQKSE